MMFRGAYDSAFYRNFRDLLHRQVDLQQSVQDLAPGEYREARAALEARWDALLAGEREHRNPEAAAPVRRAAREEVHAAAAQDG
jgi:anaerobic magnesium-protoporphyrin IX monomethyl ester cyclase